MGGYKPSAMDVRTASKAAKESALRQAGESDNEYLVRSMSIYVDEIRRRMATKDGATLRLGVKVENGKIASIMTFIEDSYRRY